MRIVFVGAVQFSKSVLEKLILSNVDVVGVITKPTPAVSSDHLDLSTYCKENNLNWKYLDDINSPESIGWTRNLEPDIIFCIGWQKLVKKEFLRISPMGVIGYHPTLLPRNRGRHPIIWTLALGLQKSGSTFFLMDEGADSGPILNQKNIEVLVSDDANSLYEKISLVALEQVSELILDLRNKALISKPQDPSLATTWRKRYFEDGKVDWRMSSYQIYNLVRALSYPYVGAHFMLNGSPVKLWKVSIVETDATDIEPGKVLDISMNGPIVKCGEGALCLSSTDPDVNLERGMYL
jgi:methionyl-tRNA formyltransferase